MEALEAVGRGEGAGDDCLWGMGRGHWSWCRRKRELGEIEQTHAEVVNTNRIKRDSGTKEKKDVRYICVYIQVSISPSRSMKSSFVAFRETCFGEE